MTREEIFGAKIKKLREEKGFSLRKAAQLIDLSHMRLSEVERGFTRGTLKPTRPSREVVKRIACVYGVPSDYLLELAGYSREHVDLSDDDSLVIDIFHSLSEDKRKMVIKIIQAIASER